MSEGDPNAEAPDRHAGAIPTAGDRRTAREELVALAEELRRDPSARDYGRDAGDPVATTTMFRDVARRYGQNRLAVAALGILVVLAMLAIFAPIISDTDPDAFDYANKFQTPFTSLERPFGTDHFGRDLWVRTWLGGRISLAIGFSVALAILAVGALYGSISGYVGGWLDNVMMRLIDAMYGLPAIPFAVIAVIVVRERFDDPNPLLYMVPALSVITWFTAARIVRGQVLTLREQEYLSAARSVGARGTRIIARHLLPNTLGVLVIAAFLEVPAAILGEATLSFLGLGVVPPDSSWGTMANDGYRYFRSYPHLIYLPGFFIAITVLCAVAVADGLRDALDPRGSRGS